MRSLGVDYGKKRVGLALSDERGSFALPYRVIDNSNNLAHELLAICQTEGADTIVIGESRTLDGRANPIMQDIKELVVKLESGNVKVILEPEFFSSAAAERIVGTDANLDARAAALILQSYLDKQK
jgi:putative holliday junction resolvase